MPSEFELGGRQVWPTMIFFRKWKDHPAEAPAIIEHVYELRQKTGAGIAAGVAAQAKSGEGLYESDFDLFKRPHPGLRKLVDWTEQTVAQAVSIANGGKFKPEQLRVNIAESWAHVTNDGGFHDAHYHPDCSWCGIYYLRAGDSGAA